VIGVAVDGSRQRSAAELFELFKTPWELAVPGRKYTAIVGIGPLSDAFDSNVIVEYVAPANGYERGRTAGAGNEQTKLATLGADTFPIYGPVALSDSTAGDIAFGCRGKALVRKSESAGRVRWTIGYDLFREVDHLLSEGQPVSQATVPTLEHHISALRDLLLASGVSIVEIPPRPAGYEYACCLTHDIDFHGIRRHAFDRTLAGFLTRGSVGTLVDVIRGRRTMAEALENWKAIVKLPFVLTGATADFWSPIDDYLRADGVPSTFFIVPFKARPGIGPDGRVDRRRAVAYELGEIRTELARALARRCEVAIHGIDAWRDEQAGRAEFNQLALVAPGSPGVRMHWLYYSQATPSLLESAGFAYDSTWGYNDACGYRAGTAQAFQPAGAERLLEIPMTLMDSALFFPDRMGLEHGAASSLWQRLIANAKRFGGAFVINWHDRSLAPERLWTRAYRRLLEDVRQGGGAWFATLSQAVDWFRWRRGVRFERTANGVDVVAPASDGLPAADVLVYRSTSSRVERLALLPGAAVTVAL
jgi:peptidoglycan/xylan/chitin deacetylase (PgdA/CDA1 family)